MKDGGDIYGTGVNVAVRLEGLADPGGILISEHAYQQAHNWKSTFATVALRP